jgi:hypothetical protein
LAGASATSARTATGAGGCVFAAGAALAATGFGVPFRLPLPFREDAVVPVVPFTALPIVLRMGFVCFAAAGFAGAGADFFTTVIFAFEATLAFAAGLAFGAVFFDGGAAARLALAGLPAFAALLLGAGFGAAVFFTGLPADFFGATDLDFTLAAGAVLRTAVLLAAAFFGAALADLLGAAFFTAGPELLFLPAGAGLDRFFAGAAGARFADAAEVLFALPAGAVTAFLAGLFPLFFRVLSAFFAMVEIHNE